MDKFKCEKCGKIFDEFEADYNFMSTKGKEYCSECIKGDKTYFIPRGDFFPNPKKK